MRESSGGSGTQIPFGNDNKGDESKGNDNEGSGKQGDGSKREGQQGDDKQGGMTTKGVASKAMVPRGKDNKGMTPDRRERCGDQERVVLRARRVASALRGATSCRPAEPSGTAMGRATTGRPVREIGAV
jgi:hypothetical protein